ncbi:MAG: Mur ligase family protein [Candidatus Saccharibacteria bacterium]
MEETNVSALRSLVGMYGWSLPASLVLQLRLHRYSGWRLLYWFWHARRFDDTEALSEIERSVSVLLALGMLLQIAVGIGFLVEWARYGSPGAWEFGLALLLSYPLVWAHLVAALASITWLVYFLFHPKKGGRALVCGVLEWQVRQLRARHDFKVVAVAGSVGKTSTKLAIADLLGQNLRVRHQAGNYNDRVTVPLVFFGLSEPSIYNVFAWWKAFGVSQSEISLPYPYDVVVVELGTDGPGQMADFAYLKPDLTVVTAVAPEHMEYFGTLDAVAAEELSVFDYSRQVLVNGDDIAGSYLAGRQFVEYSVSSKQAQYGAAVKPDGLKGQELAVRLPSGDFTAEVRYLGLQGAKVALAAAAVADMLGVKKAAISHGLPKLQPFAGRMQVLEGINGTTLIDDTYNASPLAVKAGLDVVYAAKATQRIAILGSMNELGRYSKAAHVEVGEYCDPKKLDLVVTIGRDAGRWLAPAAHKRKCRVESFMDPYEAGAYLTGKIRDGAVIFAKGSQNGVFAEEALKPLLAHPDDKTKLVRQSSYWLARKAKQFPHHG